MLETNPIQVPREWETEALGEKYACFINDNRGLKVTVQAVHRSDSRRRGLGASHHTVKLHQDWFAKGVTGERNMAAKVDTLHDAFAVARDFMAEFSAERDAITDAQVEETQRAVNGDPELADQALTTQAAAEALADAAGYSDDLLLSVLDAEVDGEYEAVAHRDGETVSVIAGDRDGLPGDVSVHELHAVFPIDRSGIGALLDVEPPITAVTHLKDVTLYRFVFGDAQETDIVLPRGTRVASPEFERTIGNVLEEKW